MSNRICTYISYLSEPSVCSTRYFWKNSKGHSALLTITDASLAIAEYALTYSSQANGQVLQAVDTVRDLHLIHSISHVPSSFFSLQRRFNSLLHDCLSIHRHRRQGAEISKTALEQAAIKAAKVVYTTISLSGLVFFKPLKLISRQHTFADEHLRGFAQSWDYISIVKSCSKIGYLGGRLATSSEKILPRAINLSLELSDVILSGLQLSRVPMHPALYLSCSLAKSLFSIYRLWSKTP